MRKLGLLLLSFTLLLLPACEGGSPTRTQASMVNDFGTSTSPDGKLSLVIKRREQSLVDFTVTPAAGGKALISDCLGSDAMRWYIYWETPTRMWVYGSDIGYFKRFDFPPGGKASTKEVKKGDKVPAEVWEGLPHSLQKDYVKNPAPAVAPPAAVEEPQRRR